MRTDRQRRGDAAEARVVDRLQLAGWLILGRNVRVGHAEIDVLAIDRTNPAALVAVEVRFRGRRDYGLAEETVDHRKVARLRAAALTLRARGRLVTGVPVPCLPIRVDLVVLEPDRLRHHRHVG